VSRHSHADQRVIRIAGARQHNLKDLDLEIPLGRITVVTGVSGSGKSSLAFDTLYAEGQRRYVETFSPYARQFMERLDPPMVDAIDGIPPAIAIARKDPVRTSRSTVGTMTEITDHVKLLFPRLGQLHCGRCDRPIQPETPEKIWERIKGLPHGSHVVITFPVPFSGTDADSLPRELGRLGFSRWLKEGAIRSLDEWKPGNGGQDLHVVADRLLLKHSERKRVVDSLEQAFQYGSGRVYVWLLPSPPGENRQGVSETGTGNPLVFSNLLQCPHCEITYRPPVPNLFSFNSPLGACPTCRGFGRIIDIDLDLVVPKPDLSLALGAIKPWGNESDHRMEFQDLMDFCRRAKFPVNVPFRDLSAAQKQAVVEGGRGFYGIRGFFRWLEGKTYKMHVRVFLSRYRSYRVCEDCDGTRFKPEALLYRLKGLTIAQLYALNVQQASRFFKALAVPKRDEASRVILSQVRNRLQYLSDVGLGYLTLDRQSRTLSGGEVQRVALTSALGSSLVNTLYVLDEPSVGLHPRDSHRLIRILKGLRDLGNTVLVVEHDPEIISNGDLMLDMGPRAGDQGGEVVYFGPTDQVGGSLTGQYLTGERRIPVPKMRQRPAPGRWLTIRGAAEHNLKQIHVRIPLGLLICLTGVSGSGKSTLAEEILYRGVKWAKGDPRGRPGRHTEIQGLEKISDCFLVDQQPIGRTPRGNPATYTKAMDPIRKLMAQTPEAVSKGLTASHFSFNTPPGRCKTCEGEGFQKIEMQFLSDVFVTCPDCKGKRFDGQVLEIRYQGKNIHDILSMTVAEALDFFGDQQKIPAALRPLDLVGLRYVRLGQPMNTFSGGEAQRLKLSPYLNTGNGSPALFIFDEPTTGLHLDDIQQLLTALRGLVAAGHTVLVVEHNMDVIKTADWIIDLGPEGGDHGGRIVGAGPPEKIAHQARSHTGRFLQAYLADRSRPCPAPPPPSAVSEPESPFGSVISVKGAREHNLRNISLSLPRNQMVVLTGVSGSGKSTLAFDILFAEGQRRYLESLAPYVRQYVKILERPEVDAVSGLPPAVAIEQRISHSSRRSTVGTLTEIYHYLRLLFSKVGVQHCPGCGRKMTAQNRNTLVAQIRNRYRNRQARILAPKVAGRKGFHRDVLTRAYGDGFREARIDGKFRRLNQDMALSRYQEHTIEIVVARLPEQRLARAVDLALEQGDGTLIMADTRGNEEIFSLSGYCPDCNMGLSALDPRLFSFNSRYGACPECDGLGQVGEPGEEEVRPCPLCLTTRLKPESLAVKVGGHSIWDLVQLPAGRLAHVLKGLSLPKKQSPIWEPLVAEIRVRVDLLNRLGLSYLALSRSGDTLSGGEAQRVRLAAQLGSNLTGVCYILDEPTIGLHPKDNHLLLKALKELKEKGNTVVVVEHDEETIRAADTLVDLGPGPGSEGGRVVAMGSLADLKKAPESVTGACFNGNPHRITSRLRPCGDRPRLTIRGAEEHNLKDIDVVFPLGTLICLTGVSGSGKSTLLKETLFKGVRNRLLNQTHGAGRCSAIEGWERVDRIMEVDHRPIGRTPRSIPASYVGFLSAVRRLFAALPESRARGYGPGRFSFNVAGGRCEVCKGQGSLKAAMAFLPDVYVPCEACQGQRFNQETLAVTYKGKTISQVLELTFADARIFFSAIPPLRKALEVVCEIGLGYLRLGQPSPTLSGGEAQRIKLAQELAKRSLGRNFYILDEPTTGLHLADVQALIRVVQALVDQGNTVAIIEHNMEIIKEADYIIDLGPEGGEAGGQVLTTGSPQEILAHHRDSHTATYLRKYLRSNS
jgi:excinuclease ABC subunit A